MQLNGSILNIKMSEGIMLKLLAFDYGASSGRAMLGKFDGRKIQLDEVHRFSNDPVMVNGSFYWDILRLYQELKQGIIKCAKNGDGDIKSMGIDTWGVDYGLLDKKGRLLGNPYHYRDSRTDGIIEAAGEVVPLADIYGETGIQFMKFNTLFQLMAHKKYDPEMLEQADKMLFIPDLLNYFLTGVKASEFTITSTSAMYSFKNQGWATELMQKLGIPTNILTDIIDTGKKVGNLTSSVCEEVGISSIPVIAVAEHDTGSAVVSVPAKNGNFAYLSSGTWSLLGLETEKPVINDTTFKLNYTNEGGINRRVRLLKNIMGLWIIQECKRHWDKTEEVLGFGELVELAQKEKPFLAFINPDDDVFYTPGNMPNKVAEYCKKTGQKVPETKGQIVRCVMESLALKYRFAIEGLKQVAGHKIDVLHIVGGGCNNKMLCQFTANAIGCEVAAGPSEATAIGNLSSQLISLGEVKNLAEARELIGKSFPLEHYEPQDVEKWNNAYEEFIKLC